MELNGCKIPWSDDLQPIVEPNCSEAEKVLEAWAPSSELLSFYLVCAFLQKNKKGSQSGWPQA